MNLPCRRLFMKWDRPSALSHGTEMRAFHAIGVAKRTGVAVSRLRCCDEKGLLPDLKRLPNGRRRFSEEDVAMVEFLGCLRETGMPIRDLKRYIALPQGPGTGRERCQLLEQRDGILAKIASLASQLTRIRSKIQMHHDALGMQPDPGTLRESV